MASRRRKKLNAAIQKDIEERDARHRATQQKMAWAPWARWSRGRARWVDELETTDEEFEDCEEADDEGGGRGEGDGRFAYWGPSLLGSWGSIRAAWGLLGAEGSRCSFGPPIVAFSWSRIMSI